MLRREGRGPICRGCEGERRRANRSTSASLVVMDAEHGFWINRFGLEEAAELAFAIWGPPAPSWSGQALLSLVASADAQ